MSSEIPTDPSLSLPPQVRKETPRVQVTDTRGKVHPMYGEAYPFFGQSTEFRDGGGDDFQPKRAPSSLYTDS